jgi:hypothetical protein
MHLCLAGMMEHVLGAVMTYVLMLVCVKNSVYSVTLCLIHDSNSINMLVNIFSDIILLQGCLNNTLTIWEHEGAQLRSMLGTYASLSDIACGTCLTQTDPDKMCPVALTSLTNVPCAELVILRGQ